MRIATPTSVIRRARSRFALTQRGADAERPDARPSTVSVLFLVSGNNGLAQRGALALRELGHTVRTAVVENAADMVAATAAGDFDLIVCPYLKAVVPEEIWRKHTTIVVHPGPPGDQGPSSLDWAITDNEPLWGVIAFAAEAELDGGPVWAWRSFGIGDGRKSSLYNGPVADAAIECIREVVANFADPDFVPTPAALVEHPVASARERPLMRQDARSFAWADGAATICRRVWAADGFPGVLTELAGREVFVYDAHPDVAVDAEPGTIVAQQHGAVQVAAGDTSVWIGHARRRGKGNIKLPAAMALADGIAGVPTVAGPTAYPGVHYQRTGDIGHVSFAFYNGAMSTEQSRRLTQALVAAQRDDTKVLLLTGGTDYFSNGIHLNVIEAADDPANEAWENIVAINGVARAILDTRDKVVLAAFTGNAGAGGVMLPLGADVVAARSGVVLNPHYATMGLFGSELHTYTLPQRVGGQTAARLTRDCEPISAHQADTLGVVDHVGPRNPGLFRQWLADLARHYTDDVWQETMDAKARRLADADPVINACERFELGQMMADMFEDRNGFAAKRHDFVR